MPKRSDQRMGHRTKAELGSVDKVQVSGEVVVPAPSDGWHEIARDWYLSLGESGQSRYMEPSDWQAARFVAQAMTENLSASRFSAQMFSAVWTAMDGLLTTEGSRRRVKVEVERKLVEDESTPAEVTQLDEYRNLLG